MKPGLDSKNTDTYPTLGSATYMLEDPDGNLEAVF